MSVNETTSSIAETATLYTASIPERMTELIEIETASMELLFERAEKSTTDLEELQTLEGKDEVQVEQVRLDLETYQLAADNYLSAYQDMLTYYGEDAYKEDITQVAEIDKALHDNYMTFIEANNSLVETLEGFIQESQI